MRSEDRIGVKQTWTRREVRSTTEAEGVACTWPKGWSRRSWTMLEQESLSVGRDRSCRVLEVISRVWNMRPRNEKPLKAYKQRIVQIMF